jgi:hypothetical protein
MQIARLKSWLVPALIFLMAAGILVAIIGNWNSWASERAEQETDDAYVRADLTPLSTKGSGVVAKVLVERLRTISLGVLPVSSGQEEAQGRAVGLLSRQVHAQAYTLATADGFVLIAGVTAAFLMVMLLMQPVKISYQDLRRMP